MENREELIHRIYEAANEPEYWADTAARIADVAGGSAVHLLLASLETGHEYINLFTRGDSGFASEYVRDYARVDFRVPRVMARPLGAFNDEREYVSPEEARSSAIHQELLPRHGVHRISGANLCLDGCIGWFGISTHRPELEFDDRQRAFLAQVSRHLLSAARFSRTHQDLQLSHDRTRDALDLVGTSLFLAATGRVRHANEAARRLLAHGFFRLRHERLRCAEGGEDRKLVAFLTSGARFARSEPLLLRQHETGLTYLVSVHDLFPQYRDGAARASGHRAISIVELDMPARIAFEEVALFCAAHGVSPAEARTVHASLNSVSLAELADTRGIGLATARQQLKSALGKMGLDSQKKLFRAFERHRLVGRG